MFLYIGTFTSFTNFGKSCISQVLAILPSLVIISFTKNDKPDISQVLEDLLNLAIYGLEPQEKRLGTDNKTRTSPTSAIAEVDSEPESVTKAEIGASNLEGPKDETDEIISELNSFNLLIF